MLNMLPADLATRTIICLYHMLKQVGLDMKKLVARIVLRCQLVGELHAAKKQRQSAFIHFVVYSCIQVFALRAG